MCMKINNKTHHFNTTIDAAFQKSSVAIVLGLLLSSGNLGATLLRGHLKRLSTPPVR